MTRWWTLPCVASALALLDGAACTAAGGEPEHATRARVELVNVSVTGALQPSDGSSQDILLSAGVWAMHGAALQMVAPGVAAQGTGIETLAEFGDRSTMLYELQGTSDVAAHGTFGPGEATYAESPLGPGIETALEIDVDAELGLSMASMFIQSNDVLFGTVPEGIALELEVGEVVDVTDSFALWDAGTEVNEEPGVGPNQAPRQTSPDMGVDETGVVARIDGTDAAGFAYPAIDSFARVTIEGLAPAAD